MRLILLIVVALAVALAAPALAQERENGTQGDVNTTITLFSANPSTPGAVIAIDTTAAMLGANLADLNFVDIRVCGRGHVFAVSGTPAEGQVLGTMTLTVRDGTRTLAEVAAELESACAQGRLDHVSAALGANTVTIQSSVPLSPEIEAEVPKRDVD